MADQVLQLGIASGAGYILFRAFRWLWRQSPQIAMVVAGGILLRATLGVILFWVSYLGLPLLRPLQSGGGFWTVTSDARAYYRYAAAGVESGLATMYPGDSSPFFVKTLALWMSFVGVSPAAGLYLNVSIYVALCVLVVRVFKPQKEWRTDLPCLASVAAFSFSPVSVIHATQTMKEDLFALLIALILVGTLGLLRALEYDHAGRRSTLAFAGPLLLIAVANYAVAGVRPYYAIFVWVMLVVALVTLGWSMRVRRLLGVARFGAQCVLVLSVVWVTYWHGAGASYWGPTMAAIPHPTNVVSALRNIRTGFVMTGGRTNMVSRPSVAPRLEAPVSDASPPVGSLAVKSALIGLAAEFIPVTVLKALSLLSFSGGRGLLPIADLDTVFLDVSVIACLTLTYRRRAVIYLPFVFAAMCLSVVTAGLLAYVITNFGSLFRLKTMIAVPIWLLCLGMNARPQEVRILTDAPTRD